MFADFIGYLFGVVVSFFEGLIEILLMPLKLLYYLLDGIIYLISRLFLMLVDLLVFIYRLMQFLFSMSKMLIDFILDIITFRIDLLSYSIPVTTVNTGMSVVTEIFNKLGIMSVLPILLTVFLWFAFAQSTIKLFRGSK